MENKVILVSKYRTQLMGIAILLIVIYHSGFGNNLGLFAFIKKFMYFGVDILFFLSGFSLYFSLNKNSNIRFFLRKRVKKIILPFIPVVIIWIFAYLEINDTLSFLEIFILNITGLSFWFEITEYFNWYIGVIIVFYFLSIPLYILIAKTNFNQLCLLISTFALGIFFIGDSRMIAISRLPIFVLGMIFANNGSKSKFSLSMNKLYFFLAILNICTLILTYFIYPSLLSYVGLYWYPFIFIVPLVLWMCIKLLEWDRNFVNILNIVLNKFGSASYSVFLVHNLVFMLLSRYEFSNLEWLGIIAITLLGALIYDKIINKLVFRG